MDLYFHSKDSIFDGRILNYQLYNCLFILYKNLEYECISTNNLSLFKKDEFSIKFSLPEKVDSVINYINSNNKDILSILAPIKFASVLWSLNSSNKILFYNVDDEIFFHYYSYQANAYSKAFFSYNNFLLNNTFLNKPYEVEFSKISFFCKYNQLNNYKKYFTGLQQMNSFNSINLKELSKFKNLLWINPYGNKVPGNSLKIINNLRNSPNSNINIKIIEPPDLSKNNALKILEHHNCCAFLSVDGLYTNSFLESKILSSYAPLLKICDFFDNISCNNSLYRSLNNLQDIETAIENLRFDLNSLNFNKIKKSKLYISNVLKIQEVANVLTLEALASVCNKNIDELILNDNISLIEGQKELYQFVRNFNNW